MFRTFLLYCTVAASVWYLFSFIPHYPPVAEKHLPLQEPNRKFLSFEVKQE